MHELLNQLLRILPALVGGGPGQPGTLPGRQTKRRRLGSASGVPPQPGRKRGALAAAPAAPGSGQLNKKATPSRSLARRKPVSGGRGALAAGGLDCLLILCWRRPAQNRATRPTTAGPGFCRRLGHNGGWASGMVPGHPVNIMLKILEQILEQILRLFPLRIRGWFDIQLGQGRGDRSQPPTEAPSDEPRP